jgi:hypothetical protein
MQDTSICLGDSVRLRITAFEAERKRHLALIQHLLLGMNAHILLYLIVAAAQVCPGNNIHAPEKDFMTINDVLKELIDEIQWLIRKTERNPLKAIAVPQGLQKDKLIV